MNEKKLQAPRDIRIRKTGPWVGGDEPGITQRGREIPSQWFLQNEGGGKSTIQGKVGKWLHLTEEL